MRSKQQNAAQSFLSDDDIRNLAGLIADGESSIPWDLSPHVLSQVLDRVHDLRHKRLVTMTARAIARKIRGVTEHKEE